DLSGDNVVFDPQLQTVRAVIDFGDVVRTQLVNDVAIAISNQLSENEIPFELAVDVLSGYHTRDPLDPDELALIYDLTWSRMLMRVIITEWRAHHFPENRAYVLRNTAHSWLQLERMMRKHPNSARNQVLRAIRQ